MKRFMMGALVMLLMALPSAADEVKLKSGGTLTGIAKESGDKVVVELAIGTVTLDRGDVVEIVPGRTALHEYAEREEKLRAGEPAAGDWYELAGWARERGLSRYVDPCLEQTVRLDPKHENAHRELGHVLHDGRWMTKVEALKAQGYVEFRGEWVKPEERDRVLAEERERREAYRARLAQRRAAALASARSEAVFVIGLPAYPRGRGSASYGGGWDPYGYYGWTYGYYGDGWGWHYTGPHTGYTWPYHGPRGHHGTVGGWGAGGGSHHGGGRGP